ncbi:TlpA family protein disulfide reductase [Chlorobaculum sp. 24CR]|jgi:thiol-disulfide isomerase/thioredoxin|uniref:TlpA family protein disulfide reductase n=1 Tax=Chlorobaculum sp. 24CR TaxID=2508878 RepID=UPI00100BF848|nr:TlpA disulfide reductase family protein [Chlorobaculum sp. 24CR]RXK89243.1 TlpA family protein disulfide reductase [Chlorobaculum sp. 24CR]
MKRFASPFAPFVAALMVLALSFVFSAQADAKPTPAPSFSGVSVDGKPFSSASLKGKAYIVNFFATWCPPCRSEIPDMVQVQKAWASKGFTFVGIAVNEQAPNVKNFMKTQGITYPVMMATPALIRAFNGYIDGGITGIPTSFIVDSSGMLTGVIVGPRSKAEFEKIASMTVAKKSSKK